MGKGNDDKLGFRSDFARSLSVNSSEDEGEKENEENEKLLLDKFLVEKGEELFPLIRGDSIDDEDSDDETQLL